MTLPKGYEYTRKGDYLYLRQVGTKSVARMMVKNPTAEQEQRFIKNAHYHLEMGLEQVYD